MDEKESRFSKANSGSSLASDIDAYWFLLLERWKLVAIAVLICASLAALYIIRTPRTYSSQCVVQVEQEKQKVVNIQEITPEDFKSTEAVKTVEQALSSTSVLVAVAQVNHLYDDPDFQGKDGAKPNDAGMVKQLNTMVTAKLRRGSRLIDINVDDTKPERAATLAISLVKAYVAQSSQQKMEVAGVATKFLTEQAESLKGKLAKAEMALQDYREKHDAVSLEDKQNTINAKLTQLNTAVTDAKSTRIKLESALRAVQQSKATKGSELIEIPGLAAVPEIAELHKQINIKETEIANIRQRYLELHPRMIAARDELKKLNENLLSAAEKAAALLEKSYNAAVEDENNLEKALHEGELQALELSKIAVPYSALQREVEADTTLFQTVLARMKETQIEEGIRNANVRVIQTPIVPTKPSKPQRFRIMVIALMAGLIIGVGIVVALDMADSSFRSVDQAEGMLGLPALAAVPKSDKKRNERRLEVIDAPATTTAEAFRGFRTAVALLGNHGPINVVLFTSAAAGEGKSYCAANYAVSLAQQGLKTLLVDGDLRRPGLTELFPETKHAPGVTAFLRDQEAFDSCHTTSEIANLSVMPTGREKATNPAELLSAGRFKDLVARAADRFDRVVIDTAPVNAVSDTLLIASLAPVICLVIRAGRTPRRSVMRACYMMERANATPTGFVLNRLRPGGGANYYYYSEGNYSSAGVYGAT